MAYHVEVASENPAAIHALRDWLGLDPGIETRLNASVPEAGELGAAEVLVIAAESIGVLTMAIRTLPDFIRSRRDGKTTYKWTVGDKKFEIEVENVNDATMLVQQILDRTRELE